MKGRTTYTEGLQALGLGSTLAPKVDISDDEGRRRQEEIDFVDSRRGPQPKKGWREKPTVNTPKLPELQLSLILDSPLGKFDPK